MGAASKRSQVASLARGLCNCSQPRRLTSVAVLYNQSRVKKEDKAVRTVSVILACLALCACATSPSDDEQEQDYPYIPSSGASPLGSKLFDAEAVPGSPMSNAFRNALRNPTYMDDGDKPNIQRLANQRFLSLGPGFVP
jgi:hypothetical protein